MHNRTAFFPAYSRYRSKIRHWSFLLIILAGISACTHSHPAGTQATNTGRVLRAASELSARERYSADEQIQAQGKLLFEQNCSACHNFLQKGIGPNLVGVTLEASPEWLVKFIRNAPQVIASGDTRATRLFEEYQQVMPPFTSLSDSDLQAILAYMHLNQPQISANAGNAHLGIALRDPVPAKISPSGGKLHLAEVATAPASADKVPLARINKMLVLPGKKDRQFIADLRGNLYEMLGTQLHGYMDMARERPGFIHTPGLATGFGSFAFHPDFYSNGLLYTTHTEKARAAPADFAYADSIQVALQWVLTEWTVKDPAAAVFSGTGRELWRINMVSSIHGVQEITFNPLARPGSPDYGLLYIGIGDGGAAENGYYFLCNSWEQPWSSVLRIDPNGHNSRNGRYGIPATNPYAQATDPATLGEIFCRGFRNPNRISWAPDGNMLITDIGHANAEEINLGLAGADYGWPEREGTFVINHRGKMDQVYALPVNDQAFRYTYPVAQYDHDEGKAISGGYVYSGKAVPRLSGRYIFGDIVSGRVFSVENRQLQAGKQAVIEELTIQLGDEETTFQQLSGSKKTDLRFGQGLENELYLYTKADGKIYRVTGYTP